MSAAHTRICYSSVSPLQEAAAVGFEQADKEGFWDQSKKEMLGKMHKFNEIWDELGLPVSAHLILQNYTNIDVAYSTPTPKAATSYS